MKYTYCTFLSNDKYLPGVISLYYSLKKTKTKYGLVAVCTENVSAPLLEYLLKHGIDVVHKPSMNLPKFVYQVNEAAKMPYWSKTLEKIRIFDLVEYDKVVYLDADMYIVRNIDDMFLLPHMSACCAGKSFPGHESWRGINSGCMVIEPAQGLGESILSLLTEDNLKQRIENKLGIGDQDLINLCFPDWPDRTELHLGEGYNCFFEYVDYYMRHKILALPDLHIIHVIGSRKPWMYNTKQLINKCKDLLLEGKLYALVVFLKWQMVLKIKCRMMN